MTQRTLHRAIVALALAVLALPACGDETVGPTDHGGIEATVDGATTDGGIETAAADAASDVGTDLTGSDLAVAWPCSVELSEIDLAAEGADAVEFLELRYAGDFAGRALDQCGSAKILVRIAVTGGCGPAQVGEIPLPAVPIPADGLWVIGTEATLGADQIVAADDLLPADTAGVLALVGADGAPVRVYGWGRCMACPGLGVPDACLPDDIGTGTVSLCGAGSSFVPERPATPGADNDCVCPAHCELLDGPCVRGQCVGSACVPVPVADGAICDDANPCTLGDACWAAKCGGDAKPCPSPDGCLPTGSCDALSGECVYGPSKCDPNASCVGGACSCDLGFEGDGASCADIDECTEGTAGCGADATCTNLPGSFQCACKDGYSGDGVVCIPGCGDALVEVVALDIWAQTLDAATVEVSSAGSPVDLTGTPAAFAVCGAETLEVDVQAKDHHPLHATLTYDGTGAATAMKVALAPSEEPVALHVTTGLRGPAGAQIRVFTVFAGLPHRWFAATGRPARHGNDVTLLRDGEEAWTAVRTELLQAEELVTAASWMWTSDIELLRDPANHASLGPTLRWENTMVGILEGLEGVERKALVNQFWSQDGLLSGLTVDDALTDKAPVLGDQFEFMGMANHAAGEFDIPFAGVDFGARVETSWPSKSGATEVASVGLPPFHATYHADASALPLGLSVFDLPVASWHQKFVTVDQRVAFIGGMNVKTTDWDTHEHAVFELRRMAFDATYDERMDVLAKVAEPDFGPRKDYMVRIEGPSAIDAVDVFHRRWKHQLQNGVEFADKSTDFDMKPPPQEVGGLQAQVVATMPAPFSEHQIMETLLRAISQAEHYIYIEDQYFRAPILASAILKRMAEAPELVLIAVTKPIAEWSDPGCWQTYQQAKSLRDAYPTRVRTYQLRAFDYVRTDCTFCQDETEAHFVDMDTHSKIVMIDDRYVEAGSCNHNNRGLLYEGELATVVFDAAWVRARRDEIFENLFGAAGYDPGLATSGFVAAFDAVANPNEAVYDAWDEEGMDLDLDGDTLPAQYLPAGFLYPLSFPTPDACFIEGVGADVT